MNNDGFPLSTDKVTLYNNLELFKTEDPLTVEEEQAATIQTVPLHSQVSGSGSKSETSTPSRKVSTSRFINVFSQFYSGGIGNSSGSNYVGSGVSSTSMPLSVAPDDESATVCGSAGRTPTKGVESKLLSMWHNVKYGWSGKIKSNFSKEQPVWLLGRCYHRKCTPPSSMESSIELTANLENKLHIGSTAYDSIMPLESYQNIQPDLHIDEIVVPQELGMDAVENQMAENPWEEGIEGFKRDFYSRIWMTYRREFPIMNGSNYTSDCGWGCMLRSGQMLLAQGLICHFLGRSNSIIV